MGVEDLEVLLKDVRKSDDREEYEVEQQVLRAVWGNSETAFLNDYITGKPDLAVAIVKAFQTYITTADGDVRHPLVTEAAIVTLQALVSNQVMEDYQPQPDRSLERLVRRLFGELLLSRVNWDVLVDVIMEAKETSDELPDVQEEA